MVPSRVTSTEPSKAAVLPELEASTGAVQVRPPSRDDESAIWSTVPPENRASCQTTYRVPFGATAMSGITSPLRTGLPVAGSTTPTVPSRLTVTGGVQVRPLSYDRDTMTEK